MFLVYGVSLVNPFVRHVCNGEFKGETTGTRSLVPNHGRSIILESTGWRQTVLCTPPRVLVQELSCRTTLFWGGSTLNMQTTAPGKFRLGDLARLEHKQPWGGVVIEILP